MSFAAFCIFFLIFELLEKEDRDRDRARQEQIDEDYYAALQAKKPHDGWDYW